MNIILFNPPLYSPSSSLYPSPLPSTKSSCPEVIICAQPPTIQPSKYDLAFMKTAMLMDLQILASFKPHPHPKILKPQLASDILADRAWLTYLMPNASSLIYTLPLHL
ncbi:hypothetical protein SCLCIDRAFT_28192 [Scleroderma citrinum Foug A]|uniref:Uncharacterized protein n=1 Tax=Scleroderma citrinum Foug A TaxID=1036808 RepID=A0A0C3A0T8_9AGAM|nr:hypothetical protein SCLCIDRAFT_28192 [Scleroderma citrinum Foug A]